MAAMKRLHLALCEHLEQINEMLIQEYEACGNCDSDNRCHCDLEPCLYENQRLLNILTLKTGDS